MAGSTFPTRLRTARKAAGMTLEQLAKKAGCTKGLVSQYEGGQVKLPRADLIFAIADALSVNPRWLATGYGAQLGVSGISEHERHFLLLMRALPDPLKEHLIGVAQSLAQASATTASGVTPFVGLKQPASQPASQQKSGQKVK